MRDPSSLAFFLGGHDLEMVTIRDLIREVDPARVFDKNLRWGAKASAYKDEIASALARNLHPVLVELDPDAGADGPPMTIVVDHHGARAGETAPTSLHQVFELLQLPRSRWTRWFDLVAANDRGYIPELRKIGATDAEIREIRDADRAAQGITPEEEAAARRAAGEAERAANGALMIVTLPHARTAAVTDHLAFSDREPENLLILSPTEMNFYGEGTVVHDLAQRFPGGWSGGALPARGFWGHAHAPRDAVVETITTLLKNHRGTRSSPVA